MSAPLSPSALAWLGAVLSERFGVAVALSRDAAGQVVLRPESGSGRLVFTRADPRFTSHAGDLPPTWWDPRGAGLEPLLGMPLPLLGDSADITGLIEHPADGELHIHCDLPGMLYWSLARVEEVGRRDLDRYGRFPASASHAGRHGYLDRPYVDEWLDILAQLLRRVLPGIVLRKPSFRMALSHDVDQPSRYAMRPFRGFARALVDDVLAGRPLSALHGAVLRASQGRTLRSSDPANTFDWLMQRSEDAGTRSAFYFICGRTNARMDAGYEIGQPAMRALLRRIHERGHEIGLHPSFETYRDAAALAREANRLRAVCEEERIPLDILGGRMHFLRWETPTTPRAWESAGMQYDSTLGYADQAGFRCGTCHEYPAFDPVADRALKLRLRPLVAMEGTIVHPAYMGLGHGERALNALTTLKERCRRAGGTFSLLWHNSELTSEADRRLYENVLTA